jgi:cell division protein FtsW
MVLDRTKTGRLSRWWWTVDRVSLVLLLLLIVVGAVLVFAGSPAVAARIDLDPMHFVWRQWPFLGLSAVAIIGISMLEVRQVQRMAFIGFLLMLVLLVLVPMMGAEIKGARRWLHIAGMSIQPSEFIKPCMAVVVGWILAQRGRNEGFPAWRWAVAVYGVVAALLLLQPDLGMTITVTGVWAAQMFLAGLPLVLVIALAAMAVGGLFGAYHLFDHVRHRIDRFLDPSTGDNYQVQKSLDAIKHGGLFGQGPGEGKVKFILPDSHTDYIFSVAAEEWGAIACVGIVMLFGGLVLRMCSKAHHEKDMFIMLSVMGLATQFAVQSIINMGVAVNVLPSKGMTLPFLSYGGSSLLAVALGAGMMLALTRRRYGQDSAFLARLDRAQHSIERK